jgi:DNA-binding phage protein
LAASCLIIRLLGFEVERVGGQKAWAKKAGLHRSHLNRTLHGHKPISKVVMRALKLRVVFVPDY